MITNDLIDGGKAFDWGRTSEDYAKYRDVYPQELYDKILSRGLCAKGQKVLDLGTGTGVIPRNMYKYGAKFTAVDISENQIRYAKRLAAENNMHIDFLVSPSEEISFPENSFDVITAFTCFFYFDHEKLIPKLKKMLKPEGRLLVGYMSWLPFEDEIAGKSEKLILKYNPCWTGAGETRRPAFIPQLYSEGFEKVCEEITDLDILFTRESWNGRIKACRGVGASLSEAEIRSFEKEHLEMLGNYPESFKIKHYAALTLLRPKDKP
ncbi:class I SAM-dependent methyltransferase [Ruminococcus sp. Marseille-P6503]|uniref:class I SAM-dependent methyltransferase n=1 Tax=Ruminococcus sp. Marseille-P6503 TaxID=2364796 RepID=UPI000F525D74|nr:class I SAM-dependent methyltransferase [Ruminococcus sp. Marseille-P6503]